MSNDLSVYSLNDLMVALELVDNYASNHTLTEGMKAGRTRLVEEIESRSKHEFINYILNQGDKFKHKQS